MKTKIFYALLFIALIQAEAIAQNEEKSQGKHGIAVGGMRYSSVISANYNYRLWQNPAENFRFGLQAGFGYGKNFDRYTGLSLPLGVFSEYGKKHRIGLDANIIYKINTNKLEAFVPGFGYRDVDVVFSAGAVTASLYYAYHFGKNLNYNAGLGYNFQAYFGGRYGIENQTPNYYAPFIFVGYTF